MREVNSENFVSFVRGHGAGYSSAPVDGESHIRQRAVSSRALEFARERAAEQLAFQRAATRQPKDRPEEN